MRVDRSQDLAWSHAFDALDYFFFGAPSVLNPVLISTNVGEKQKFQVEILSHGLCDPDPGLWGPDPVILTVET